MSLNFEGEDPIENEKIQIDFSKMEISNAPNEDPVIGSFYAIDAVD